MVTKTPVAEWIGWIRLGNGPWQAVSSASTYAEADRKAGDYLAALPNLPKAIESYTGKKGNKPPMPRGAA